uniref:Uncharacterized protein n=1 Tax=Alexandrium monilatum TaxID=311494 RepID=A0A7S4WA49_9DINO
MAHATRNAFVILQAATAALAAAGASLGVSPQDDETSLVQVRLTVAKKVEKGSHSSIILESPAKVTHDMFNNTAFQIQSLGEVMSYSGRIHSMAHSGRWAGWRHFSHAHPNGTLVNEKLVQESQMNFFRSAPRREWLILVSVCFALCVFDGMVLRRVSDSFRGHLAVICIWVGMAGLYLWGVWVRMGRQQGIEWLSGYILEWMLSMDNLFIFHLVFGTYKTPQAQIHKAVFVGIIGAVVMRMVFFLVVSTLLNAFGWFRWPFGAMLVWSGVEAVRGDEDEDTDVKDTRLVQFLRWAFGSFIKDGYDTEGTSIFVVDKKTRQVQLSMLFVVIVIVEFSDIIFALDSVSAKVAQIPNQYIAFSSSVMAMYGLRATFFVVQDLVEMFDLLKYGLGVILVFIGLELMFARWIHMASGLECVLIVAVFLICISASHVKNYFWPDPNKEVEEAGENQESSMGKEHPFIVHKD